MTILSLVYIRFRSISPEPIELLPPLIRRHSSNYAGTHTTTAQSQHRTRDRHGLTASLAATRCKGEVEGNPVGGSGFVWATDERNYR